VDKFRDDERNFVINLYELHPSVSVCKRATDVLFSRKQGYGHKIV